MWWTPDEVWPNASIPFPPMNVVILELDHPAQSPHAFGILDTPMWPNRYFGGAYFPGTQPKPAYNDRGYFLTEEEALNAAEQAHIGFLRQQEAQKTRNSQMATA